MHVGTSIFLLAFAFAFAFALARFTREMQAQGIEKFSISCLSACICIVVVHSTRGLRNRANSRTWASSHENYLKSISGSVSYCVVILRRTPHWSVRMTSRNFRLLTWEQHKTTFAAWPRTNKFRIIIMARGDSLSYFILSCSQVCLLTCAFA